jgi:hypothetical protein
MASMGSRLGPRPGGGQIFIYPFDEVNDEEEELQLSAVESFRVIYFLFIVDAAIASLDCRFEQLKESEKVFGFLYNSKNLKSIDESNLWKKIHYFCRNFAHKKSDADLMISFLN